VWINRFSSSLILLLYYCRISLRLRFPPLGPPVAGTPSEINFRTTIYPPPKE
jgi:hypothetical protein